MAEPKEPLVSVIVISLNAESTIEACLQSIFSQGYGNIEVILVDKNSRDSTVERAAKFPVRILRGEVERCTQWNKGARESKGEFLYFTGSDLKVHPDFISHAVEKCLAAPCSAVYSTVRTETRSYWGRVRGLELEFYLLDTDWQAARFIRRDAFFKVGGWNEALVAGEDWDMQDRLNAAGFVTLGVGPYPETHIDTHCSFSGLCRKFYYYGRTLRSYARRNTEYRSFSRFQPFRPVFFRHPGLFAKNLALVPGFILYKVAQYGFSFLGYALG